MPPQARCNIDNARNPSDSHGRECCSHDVQGPGVKGSPDVYVNGQMAMRIGDPGVHKGCCDSETWVVARGSRTVYFNDIPAARKGDQTTHCGGTGQFIMGSNNVIVGG